MLKKRVLTSLIGLPVLIAVIWFDDFIPLFTILVAALGILSSLEFSRLVSVSGIKSFTIYSILAVIVFILLRDVKILDAIDPVLNGNWILLVLLVLLTLPVITSRIVNRNGSGNRWISGIWAVIGIVITGWMLGNLVAMRGLEDGRNWVFFTLFVTFAYDTFAFFTGRSLGRHKMAPRVSPGKTWEGAAGGLIGALLVSLFFTLSTPLGLPITWYHAILLGVLVSVFGQGGDLLESRFKRYTGVKDSGKALPGHGGFLDRIDSIVFTVLVVYHYVIWVIQ